MKWLLLIGLLLPSVGFAETDLKLFTMQPGADGSESYSTNIQILLIMTMLSVLPALLMTMTSFTRIIVVLAILRQAMGTMQTPSNQILIGLALFTSMFIMMPAFEEIYEKAVEPYMAGDLVFESALDEGVQPLRVFMLNQTREVDLMMFASLAGVDSFDQNEEIPLHILLPSFVTSELKTAFQIYPVLNHRPCGRECADVDGHDDVITDDYFIAVQDYAFCLGRWLVFGFGHARR